MEKLLENIYNFFRLIRGTLKYSRGQIFRTDDTRTKNEELHAA